MRWLVAVGMLVAAAVGTLIVVKLWDDIRGLMDGGMVRKRDVRK